MSAFGATHPSGACHTGRKSEIAITFLVIMHSIVPVILQSSARVDITFPVVM